jgi:hypothetical protein
MVDVVILNPSEAVHYIAPHGSRDTADHLILVPDHV